MGWLKRSALLCGWLDTVHLLLETGCEPAARVLAKLRACQPRWPSGLVGVVLHLLLQLCSDCQRNCPRQVFKPSLFRCCSLCCSARACQLPLAAHVPALRGHSFFRLPAHPSHSGCSVWA